MIPSVIALFGEAQKGELETAYYCEDLEHLFEFLGEPPQETQGLYFAVQSLLYGRPCLYFRVQEEGLSVSDYYYGLHLLEDLPKHIPHLGALFLPGVGSKDLIQEGISICRHHRSLLLMNEKDFYDYMTDFMS